MLIILGLVELVIKKSLIFFFSCFILKARESTMHSIPSIACSMNYPKESSIWHYPSAARIVVNLAEKFFNENLFPQFVKTVININIPNISPSEIKGVKYVKQGYSKFLDYYQEVKNTDTNKPNQRSFRLEGKLNDVDQSNEFDTKALLEGYITLTTLGLIYSSEDNEDQKLRELDCSQITDGI